MTAPAAEVFLGLSVAASWLGALGFARLRSAFDRIHCITFTNVTAGGFLLVAAILQEGIGSRTLKLLFLIIAVLLNGAALGHATAHALLLRIENEDDET